MIAITAPDNRVQWFAFMHSLICQKFIKFKADLKVVAVTAGNFKNVQLFSLGYGIGN
jgi:hypothetical protein